MAITNEQIIFTQSQNLLKEGKLKATGRVLVLEDAAGNKMEFPEAEPIHTFAVWKSIGFSVKKAKRPLHSSRSGTIATARRAQTVSRKRRKKAAIAT